MDNKKAYKTELEKREILRLNNEETNKLTKECLSMALIYLMNEMDFNKITITDIVKRAGVSRTAFYRNYSVKEDILKEIGQEVTNKLTLILENPEHKNDLYSVFLELFSTLKDNAEIISLLINANIPFDSMFKNGSFISYRYPSKTIEDKYTKIAAEAALYKIIITWNKDGMKQSPKKMAALCQSIFDGISGIL